MSKYIIVTDTPHLIPPSDQYLIMTPQDFMGTSSSRLSFKKGTRVINISTSFDYLSEGYYVSLLAQARGLQSFPELANIIAINWRRNTAYAFPELNALLEKHFSVPFEEPLVRRFTSFFGRHASPNIDPIARRIFDLFRLPIFSFDIKYSGKNKWSIVRVDARPLRRILSEQMPQFNQDLAYFTGTAWKGPSKKRQERYWLAILHNPNEQNKPSNAGALKKFKSIGKKLGIWVELITKDDFSSLLEFDALFIRETTNIYNHTYRFAQKAEWEGIPTIDDTNAIVKCCNKVYLNELLDIHNIDKPHTIVLNRKNFNNFKDTITHYPCVLKIPDGSFSIGVYKINHQQELIDRSMLLFDRSEIILCQEFLPSKFDWRIGVLNNQLLFATKYFMAKNHWQIYNHEAKQPGNRVGSSECVPLDCIPESVSRLALRTASLIGDGLYGIDLKETEDGRVVVIEINDNPNIDQGVEDLLLGDNLYKRILEYFVMKIDA